MIVKKLYRRIINKAYNKKQKRFEHTTIIDYLGWFLFGFIPIYLIQLDKREDVVLDEDDGEKSTITYGINRTYNHLMVTNHEK